MFKESKKFKKFQALWLSMWVLPLCFLCHGCGKKVNQKSSAKTERTPALTSGSVELSNYVEGSGPAAYALPQSADVFIPTKLEFVTGFPKSQTKMVFHSGSEEEFFCLYGYGHDTDPEYSLINCYFNGNHMEMRGGDKIFMGADDIIAIRSANPEEWANIEAEVEIDWY